MNDLSIAIAKSIAKVNRTFYTHYEDGSQVYQISAVSIIERMIRMLKPKSNENILEIGTGSAYSTALLSNIVSEGGMITSIDIDIAVVVSAKMRSQYSKNKFNLAGCDR